MTTTEVLQAAKDLISDPTRWTQGAYARDEFGYGISPISLSACQWCMHGAIRLAAGEYSKRRHSAIQVLSRVVYPIPEFNDRSTHPQVMNAFDRAIALAKQEESASTPATKET